MAASNVSLTKNTYISLGLAITLILAIVFNEVRFANLKSRVDNHLTDINIHHNGMAEIRRDMNLMKDRFVSTKELSLQLANIQLKLEKIEEKIK